MAELEVSNQIRQGTVLIPHGFGLIYGDTVYGMNINKLTQNQDTAFLGKLFDTFGMICGGEATEFEYHLQLSSGVFYLCIVQVIK